MSIITNFEDILSFLSSYISDSKKSEFKRQELSFSSKFDLNDFGSNNNTSENAIYFQLVSKLFLLHDVVGMSNKLLSKCLIKKMRTEDCSLFLEYFSEKDFKLITNVICNLSDTKYVIVISNLSYEILDNLILSDTITKALWYRSSAPMIIITKNVYQIENQEPREQTTKSKSNNFEEISIAFETQLLQLLSAVTKINKDLIFSQTYTFWVFKISSLMFGVLIPRFESEKNCLINVWPIVPAASFFSSKKSISNLKIMDKDKMLFYSIADSVKQNSKLNGINLKNEICNGLTLPMLFQNRININGLYMTFFFEFLRENDHFEYPLSTEDSTIFLKCQHCNITFNNVFQFVRHWWVAKQIKVFRCHMCNERTISLTKLASHYKSVHYNYLETIKDKTWKSIQYNDSSNTITNSIISNQYDNRYPKQRKCPLCNTYKEGLHYMRIHIKECHLAEIMTLAVNKIKETLPQRRFGTSSLPVFALDNKNRPFSRDQFLKLFSYQIMCPLCKDSYLKFSDSLTFFTHIARDHTSTNNTISENLNRYSKKQKLQNDSFKDSNFSTLNDTIDKFDLFDSKNSDTYNSPNSTKTISILKYDTSCKSSQLTISDFVDNLNTNDKHLLQNILSKALNENLMSDDNDQFDFMETASLMKKNDERI